jgi:hypothetical protein
MNLGREQEQARLAALEQARQENVRIANAIIKSFELIFKRQRKIDDPCLRSCLFIDKLSTALNIAAGTAIGVISEDEMSNNIRENLSELISTLNEEFDQLTQWVRSPQYSPDHPFGHKVLEETAKQFRKDASSNDV